MRNFQKINNKTERMLKKIVFVLFVVAFAACGSTPRVNLDREIGSIKPRVEHGAIAQEIAAVFAKHTYKTVTLNDSISSIIFDNLLKALDGSKNYLLQEDVDAFEKYRFNLGSDFENGDLSAPYHMFNVFVQRYLERMDYAILQVEKPHNFDVKDEFVYLRSDLPYFKNKAEADTQWSKRVKFDLLNLRMSTANLTDSAVLKHKDILVKRYTELISQTKKSDSNEAFQVIMAAFTDAIDPHTSYFNPYFAQQYNEGISNTFEGIGATLTMENEVVKVNDIVVGGPVYRAKSLQIDDKIVAVAQGDEGEFEDIVGWRLDRAVSKIKGPKSTVVRLKVIPAGQDLTSQPVIVSITREKIVMEEESAKKEVKTVKGADGKSYKVGIISIPKFYLDFNAYRNRDPNYKSTTRDVRLILDTLKQEKVDAVLIDLRNNGGGSLIESIELTGLFIPSGPVVQVRDTRNQVEVNSDNDPSISWEGPMGVLVNRMSASASEIFAGAIQDYGRGLIIGSTTYGKGTVQSAVDMERIMSATNRLLLKAQVSDSDIVLPVGAPRFGQLNLTMAKYYRITGHSTQHRGVLPDVMFPSLIDETKYGESTYTAALPWDQIESSNFKPYMNLKPFVPAIQQAHKLRMEKSPEYGFMLDDIKLSEAREKETTTTLNEVDLKKEREEESKKIRERVNLILKYRGLPEWKVGEPQPKLQLDFIQDESLLVMSDLIQALKNVK